MLIVNNINRLSIYYNILASFLEEQSEESGDLHILIGGCNVRKEIFLELHNLEKSLQDNFELELKKHDMQQKELEGNDNISPAPIEPPLIPLDIAENLLPITEVRKTLASGLRGFASSLPSNIKKTLQSTGGKKTTYRLNGEKVVLLHKNKKVQRSIYVKAKGKAKYCKIDKEYVLLSKIKNKIQ